MTDDCHACRHPQAKHHKADVPETWVQSGAQCWVWLPKDQGLCPCNDYQTEQQP